jgi:hypothetical protein
MRTIVLTPNNTSNYNIRTAAGNPIGPVRVSCIATGTITSTDGSGNPALDTGTGWHVASQLYLKNTGTIKGGKGAKGADGVGLLADSGYGGAGGTGGSGSGVTFPTAGSSGTRGSNGYATNGISGNRGAPGVYARVKLVIDNTGGTISGGVGGLGGNGAIGYGGDGGGGGGGGSGGARWANASNPGDSSQWVYQPGGRGGTGQQLINGVYGSGPFDNVITVGGEGGIGGTLGRPGYSGSPGITYSPGVSITNWPNAAGGPAGAAGNNYYSSDGSDGPAGYSVAGAAVVKFISNGNLVGSTSGT